MKLLLLDEGLYQTLYISRKLQRFADVTIACSNPRWIKRAKHLPVKLIATSKPDSEKYLQEIDALAPQFDKILPISDNATLVAYQQQTIWQDKIFPQIPAETFHTANDKFEATQFAQQLDILCPITLLISQAADLQRAANKLGFPLIIKNTLGCSGAGVRICHNNTQLVIAHSELQKNNNDRIFCQQYIAGDTFGASGLFLNGQALRTYCWQKTSMYPLLTGPSKRCLSTTDLALSKLMISLCQALNWNGLIDMDFIRDAQGRYYFLEINPRASGSLSATEDAGVDMVTPIWTMLEGKTPAAKLDSKDALDSVLFPQYILSACKEDSYEKLWQILTDKSLWASAPDEPRYLQWYRREIAHAWIHSLRRTLTNSLKKLLPTKNLA